MMMSQEEDTLLTVVRVNLTPKHTECSAPNFFQYGLSRATGTVHDHQNTTATAAAFHFAELR